MPPTIKNALINALGTALYVILIASFFFYAPKFLNNAGKADTMLAPAAMLLLFVFSAGVTSSLVFGRPVLWYVEGKKQEALSLLFYTLAFLFAIIAILFAVAYSMA
ncbi:MAG: hypothetical protein AAB867_01215 [Patescibacteria group bacterium]